jgi:hypothetical protein
VSAGQGVIENMKNELWDLPLRELDDESSRPVEAPTHPLEPSRALSASPKPPSPTGAEAYRCPPISGVELGRNAGISEMLVSRKCWYLGEDVETRQPGAQPVGQYPQSGKDLRGIGGGLPAKVIHRAPSAIFGAVEPRPVAPISKVSAKIGHPAIAAAARRK